MDEHADEYLHRHPLTDTNKDRGNIYAHTDQYANTNANSDLYLHPHLDGDVVDVHEHADEDAHADSDIYKYHVVWNPAGHQYLHQYTITDLHRHDNEHACGNTNTNPDYDANRDTIANQHVHLHVDTQPDPDADPHTDDDAHTDGDAHAHRDADPYTHRNEHRLSHLHGNPYGEAESLSGT